MNKIESIVDINIRLHKISRLTINSFLNSLKKSNAQIHTTHHILLAYCLKSIDLIEGINKLYEMNLSENAQILIRTLFETNLNFGHVVKLATENIDNAANEIMACMMIREAHKTKQQNLESNRLNKISDEFLKNYSEKEIKNIRQYGFPREKIIDRAKNDNKEESYKIMYKNFSRNVHALDFQEYFVKLGIRDYGETYDEKYVLRNSAALNHAHTCFYQIIKFCCMEFEWNISDKLEDIHREFINIC